LSFKLALDNRHPYLASRGLHEDTIETFGLGYCSRGLLEGRIAIPIHDQGGQLVAYAGRAVDSSLAEREGKYRFPSHFRKSPVVYNLSRVAPLARSSGLVIVEGFFSVFHLYQAGVPNVVALMGTALSEAHEDLLLAAVGGGGKVSLMLDRDEAGRAGTEELTRKLIRKVHVRVVDYETAQPDGLSKGVLRRLLLLHE
jgi:DNA primase